MEHRLLPIVDTFFLVIRDTDAAMLLLQPVTTMSKARQFKDPQGFIQKRLIQALQRTGVNLVLGAAAEVGGVAPVGNAQVKDYRCLFEVGDDSAADAVLPADLKLLHVRESFLRCLVVCAQDDDRIGRTVWDPWLQWGKTVRPDLVNWDKVKDEQSEAERAGSAKAALILQAGMSLTDLARGEAP